MLKLEQDTIVIDSVTPLDIPSIVIDGLGDFDGDYSDDQHQAANNALDGLDDAIIDLTIV
jgi:hypothetical protein